MLQYNINGEKSPYLNIYAALHSWDASFCDRIYYPNPNCSSLSTYKLCTTYCISLKNIGVAIAASACQRLSTFPYETEILNFAEKNHEERVQCKVSVTVQPSPKTMWKDLIVQHPSAKKECCSHHQTCLVTIERFQEN